MFTFPLADDAHLRPLDDVDADALYAVIEADRPLLAEWLPWAAEQTLADLVTFIRSAREAWAADLGFQATIVDRGAPVGVIGFSRMDRANRSVGLGYWLGTTAQRRGLVTEATRALTDHAFGVWRLNRLEIRAGVDNVRSRRVPERLGFVNEGVLRQAERIGDRYVDHVVYGMLAQDWRQRGVRPAV